MLRTSPPWKPQSSHILLPKKIVISFGDETDGIFHSELGALCWPFPPLSALLPSKGKIGMCMRFATCLESNNRIQTGMGIPYVSASGESNRDLLLDLSWGIQSIQVILLMESLGGLVYPSNISLWICSDPFSIHSSWYVWVKRGCGTLEFMT